MTLGEIWAGEPNWPGNSDTDEELNNVENISILGGRLGWVGVGDISGRVEAIAPFLSAHVSLLVRCLYGSLLAARREEIFEEPTVLECKPTSGREWVSVYRDKVSIPPLPAMSSLPTDMISGARASILKIHTEPLTSAFGDEFRTPGHWQGANLVGFTARANYMILRLAHQRGGIQL